MNIKKDKNNITVKLLGLYDTLIATIPNVERKGATMPYTSLNGNMFSFFAKDGSFGLRLPQEQREKFLNQYKTTLYEAHGSILKEYVVVPKMLFKDIKKLKKYFKMSYDYAKTLKAKTKKNIK